MTDSTKMISKLAKFVCNVFEHPCVVGSHDFVEALHGVDPTIATRLRMVPINADGVVARPVYRQAKHDLLIAFTDELTDHEPLFDALRVLSKFDDTVAVGIVVPKRRVRLVTRTYTRQKLDVIASDTDVSESKLVGTAFLADLWESFDD